MGTHALSNFHFVRPGKTLRDKIDFQSHIQDSVVWLLSLDNPDTAGVS